MSKPQDGPLSFKSDILYYYDRMFTLCYMLHLLFTGQDVHDLKLHVAKQENVHFEVHWLVDQTAG